MQRILIVDDQEPNLLALEATLRSPELELVCVRSGEQALQSFRAAAFDVAILDVLMPGMNGLQTAAALRALAPKLPLIFISALADESEIFCAAQELGAVACLLSPVHGQTLRALVANLSAATLPEDV